MAEYKGFISFHKYFAIFIKGVLVSPESIDLFIAEYKSHGVVPFIHRYIVYAAVSDSPNTVERLISMFRFVSGFGRA